MYKLTINNTTVIRLKDNASIPRDSNNVDYKEYVSYLESGGVVQPADIPPPDPIIVSPRQIRQALTAKGLRASVEAAVLAGDQDLKDWWEFATLFEENHPLIITMAQSLGVSLEQLHDLFVLAGSL